MIRSLILVLCSLFLNLSSVSLSNLKNSSVKQLAIELSENGVRFSAMEGEHVQRHEFAFTDKKDYRYKEQLDEFLVQSGLKDKNFDEHTVSWGSFRSTLIPTNIFGESKPEDLFRLCFGPDIPASHIDYNRIPEQVLVNLYEIPMWVKSFFVVKYPRSVIQHEGSHTIRGIFAENTFRTKATIVLFSNFFLLAILKENKLQFYSVFEYQEVDDVVYHLMFTLQQKEFLGDTGSIQICPGVGAQNEKMSELKEKLSQLQDLKQMKIEINEHFTINSQKLCV